MIAPLAKFMDWAAIQVLARMPHTYGQSPRLEEALQFLKGPGFIPAESQQARVEFEKLAPRWGCGAIRLVDGWRDWRRAATRGWPLSF
jgi:hypothetical protein